MKNSILKKLSFAFAGAALSLAVSFPAMAAVPSGTLEGADNASVYGWVWDSDSYGHVIPVEISIFSAGSSQILKSDTIKADYYQEKLQETIGDGYHGFRYEVDWNKFDGDELRVTACAVTDEDRVCLGELTYNKVSGTFTMIGSSQDTPSGMISPQGPESASTKVQGPGQVSVSTQAPGEVSVTAQSLRTDEAAVSTQAPVKSAVKDTAVTADASPAADTSSSSDKPVPPWQRGPGVTPKKKAEPEKQSLGMFTITGYCNCQSCSGGSNLTYSGTVPQADHTISADINIFPIGTRLMIDDIIYTVEDVGSSVVQNKIDIFYATHEEAVAHGTTTTEVFAVAD
jgi:3D (Asp-Asp-Asp) domain-containing protein